MMIAIYIVLGLAITVIALIYLGLPLLIMMTNTFRCRVEGTIRDIDPASFSGVDRHFMDKVRAALEPVGFREIGYARSKGFFDDGIEHYFVMIHEPSATFVSAESIYASPEDTSPSEQAVHFSTDYENGVQLLTNNGDYITTLDCPKSEHAIEMPGTQDPVTLWRYHEARLQDERQRMTAVPINPDHSAAELYTRDMRRGISERAKTLCWKKLEEGVYAISFIGYFLTTWSQIPPLRNIMLTKRRAAEKQLEDRYPEITFPTKGVAVKR